MNSSFTLKYALEELSPREELEGQILNISQIRVIRNRLVNAANQLMHLQKESNQSVEQFFENHAFLSGQIKLLEDILMDSTVAQEDLSTNLHTSQD